MAECLSAYPFAGIRLTRADVEWLIAALPDADDAERSGSQESDEFFETQQELAETAEREL